jgi:hypothetical protein
MMIEIGIVQNDDLEGSDQSGLENRKLRLRMVAGLVAVAGGVSDTLRYTFWR